MFLSIIILNYNSTSLIIDCLLSLQNQTFNNFEIMLVENNSEEKYRHDLYKFLKSNILNKEFLSKIILIESKKNLGFTGGNNLGLKRTRGELILLLNNDTVHEKLFLEKMVNLFLRKNIDIAQPKICYYSKKDFIWGLGGIVNKFSYNIFKHLNFNKYNIEYGEKIIPIDYAIGCAIFIKKSVLKTIGLLDNNYFMYCEESDLCFRAKRHGYDRIVCYPSAKIYHKVSNEFSNSFKRYYFRNRMIFVCKFFPFILILWQILMQFIQIILFTFNFKKTQFDVHFFKKSILSTLNGLHQGLKIRLI